MSQPISATIIAQALSLPEGERAMIVQKLLLSFDGSEIFEYNRPGQDSVIKRVPPPQFKGRVRELGDVMSSIPEKDWGLPD
jgi:hypothetical protein